MCLVKKDDRVRQAVKKALQELSKVLLAYIWIVHQAHALKIRISQRLLEDEGVI